MTSEIDELADDIAKFVTGGDSIEGAVRRLQRYRVPEDVLNEARRIYEVRVGRIRELKDPGALVATALKDRDWYPGPQKNDMFWPALNGVLARSIDAKALTAVDNSSSKVVGLMRPPGMPEISTRGLVLGYVQSGKTTNFMSVIAKAADVGYRLFIVLSGITDNLRSQTQERLEESLANSESQTADSWHWLTELEADFQRRDNAGNLLRDTNQRLIAVVKKNPYRLKRLVQWLEKAGPTTLEGCPIVVIDDEADQASIDVGKGRRSRINGLISQILDKPKATYIAYTATPFANLLIAPDDYKSLYPSDFIVDLPRSDDYFGAERLFGREPLTPDETDDLDTDGLDIIRHVQPTETAMVQPPRGRGAVDTWNAELPASLVDAVHWFLLGTAARHVRGKTSAHSSMLVHTSMLSAAHEKVAHKIERYLDAAKDTLENDRDELWDGLQRLWDAESMRMLPEDGSAQTTWTEVRPHVAGILAKTKVIVDNYRSNQRLSYSKDAPTTAIVVGGNTLSRGLTLEGLICSYFVRSASAYDTLLQMGRWFGYRTGYADLTRIWMTADMEQWFFDLATVEEEVRRAIRRYEQEGLTPAELPVLIRSHPAMAITSAAKMRNAVRASISYSGSRQQTILFNHRDEAWLAENIAATKRFLSSALEYEGKSTETAASGRTALRGVPASNVLAYLDEYLFHKDAYRVRSDLLRGYIQTQNAAGYLQTWNVVVMGHPTADNGNIALGLSHDVNLIQRTRLYMPGIEHANIKGLVSAVDRLADVEQSTRDIRGMVQGTMSDESLLKLREELVGDVGLLCIYPISKNSTPQAQAKPNGKLRRVALDAVDDVIGLGFFFPTSRTPDGAYSYYSADLSALRIDEADEDELAAADAADEAQGEAADAAVTG